MRSKKYFATVIITGLFLNILIAIPAFAQSSEVDEKTESPFSFEFSAGVEYDDNISVNELDTNTNSDDFSAVFDGNIRFEKDVGSNTDFELSYNFSQSLHDEFTDFDIQSHLGSASISHDFGSFDAGAAYRFVFSRLGGESFLTLQQFSPYVTKFFGGKFFIRADYTYTDKDFDNRVDRDAETHAGGADFYYFIDGVRTYLVFGYKYKNEDAVDPQFDFNAHNLKVQFSQRFPIGERNLKLKVRWRYETRDYTSITPSINAQRDDDRHRLEIELEIPITDRIFVLAEYEYSDFSSNLPSADYTQSFAGLRVGIRL